MLYFVEAGTLRFGELRKLIPGPTKKMLTQQLRELERDEIIRRKVYAQVPQDGIFAHPARPKPETHLEADVCLGKEAPRALCPHEKLRQ